MNSRIGRTVGHGDLVLALFVVAVAMMLLLPLPTHLLDILLTLNLTISLLLLFVGLYIPNAISLLAFPSLLLLTTLFRLSLNVASTRLILLQGYAGEVIESFGTFLIRGEIAVGVIIFLIITAVNLIVVAKGSSRVSEVAARFALDALPGKQMAIDADLRTGLITPDEAAHRREELRKESQLYGSMDGSMKFVQGDAIAGLFIIATNILGGMYIGISRGMSVGDALNTYTILTVGDGLVSQIPSLLISICAGIVVTRISSSESATLAGDVGGQLFGRPGLLILSGGLVLGLGLVPGLPWLPFIFVGAAFVLCGFWLQRRGPLVGSVPLGLPEYAPKLLDRLPFSAPRERRASLPSPISGNDTQSREDTSVVTVMLDTGHLMPLFKQRTSRLQYWLRELQMDFFESTGLSMPDVGFVAGEELAGSSYAIKIRGKSIESNEIPSDLILVEVHPNAAIVFGCEVVREERFPLDGQLLFWTYNTPNTRRILEQSEVKYYDPLEFIALRIVRYLKSHPEELVAMTDVFSWVKHFEKRHPGLIAESIDREFVSVSRLTELIQELVRQGINVSDFSRIIEGVAGYCSSFGSRLTAEDQFVLTDLMAYMRRSRSREVLSRVLTRGEVVQAVILSNQTNSLVEELKLTERDLNEVRLASTESSRAWGQLNRRLDELKGSWLSRGVLPLVILCKSESVAALVALFRFAQLEASVLAIDELDMRTRVEVAAVW